MNITEHDPFAKLFDVYLDGVKVVGWVEADTEKGIVKLKDPKIFWNTKNAPIIVKYGKVEIHDTHTWVVYT